MQIIFDDKDLGYSLWQQKMKILHLSWLFILG